MTITVTKKRVSEIEVGDTVDFDQHTGLSLYWDLLTRESVSVLSYPCSGQAIVSHIETDNMQLNSKAKPRFYVFSFEGHKRTVKLHNSSKLPVVDQ